MFQSNILLVLIGSVIASGHVLRHGKHCVHHAKPLEMALASPMLPLAEPLPAFDPMHHHLGMPPFLHPAVQQSSNLFYKPHIMMSPAPIPIATELIKKDCKKPNDEPQIVIEEPAILPPAHAFVLPTPTEEVIEMRPIPQAPVLPPFTMPELPAPIVLEEPEYSAPIFPEMHLALPELPAPMPVEVAAPCDPVIPTIPEMAEIPTVPEFTPIEIPAAPELPPFVMPEIPKVIIKEPKPCLHDIIMPSAPEFIPMAIPEYPLAEPVQEIVEPMPMVIPQPPELPPFTMPEIPATVVVEHPTPILPPAPFYTEAVELAPPCPPIMAEPMPIEIPTAPVLPTFEMPAVPLYVEKPIHVQEMPILMEKPCPEDEMVLEQIPALHHVPHGPLALANFYAQNIIVDRVLPNMIVGQNMLPNGLEVVPAEAKYPVIPHSYVASAAY